MTKAEIKEAVYKNGMNPARHDEENYLFCQAYLQTETENFHNIKRARIDAYIMDHYSIEFSDYDLLAGRYSLHFPMDEEKRNLICEVNKMLEKTGRYQSGTVTAATVHRVLDYEKLLSCGIRGILEEIREKKAQLAFTEAKDYEAETVYESMIIDLEAVCRFARRYQKRLSEESEKETDLKRKAEWKKMSDLFSVIPYEPASSFYEAMQSTWFLQFCMQIIGDTCLSGRIDQYLYPFYKKDIENGVLTREFAFELIEQLYYKNNELYNSWPASVMIGGENRRGEPVWNELTYMCVEAIRTTELVNPAVAVCYTEKMPEDLLEKCVEIISEGYTKPALFNDAVIQKGLRQAGVTEEDAKDYVHSTCVEITPVGNSNILVATPYINLCKIFEFILQEKTYPYVIGEIEEIFPGGGGNTQELYLLHDVDVRLDELKTFEQFLTLFERIMSEVIGAHVKAALRLILMRQQYASSPLASAFLNSCISRGKDAGAGGAKYNYCYPCFPGVINVIDSLAAIKKAVYDDQVLSLREMAELCASDFEGKAEWHQYLLNKCPKFGNNKKEVDDIGKHIYDFINRELEKYKSSLNASLHPSYFAYINHGTMGEMTDATPDGRRKGTALSEHLGAFRGMDKSGPIAVLRSISKLDQSLGIGGIATNYRFAKGFTGSAKGRKAIADFIRLFMAKGCFEIQFNVVDRNDLLRAQQNPEAYQTLMVRVAGYSDYFVNLPLVIQNEIIERTEVDSM